MSIDVVKIDKSFVDDIIRNPKQQNVVKSIIDLAKILNMEVLAEGVEDMNQVQILKDLDCYNIQGFVYSKPVEFEKFKDILAKN